VSARRANDKSGLQISWTTISYRSAALAILGVIGLIVLVVWFMSPERSQKTLEKVQEIAQVVGAKMGIGDPPKRPLPTGPQQAHFTAIDGTVRVKKASGNTWTNANYNLPLERGDVVQTSSEGIARVVFADGTSYTVKQDSLIVVDDNSVTSNQQTQVSVQVTTGTVDLTTSTFGAGSRSQVTVAGATASFSPESSAQVRNNPREDQHEILVKKGAGEVQRLGETVRLTEFEKVTFKAESTEMAKSRELGPPTLIGPANMAPIFASGSHSAVQFTWTPSEKATGYRIKVSRNPYFSSTVIDMRTRTAGLTAELGEGAYYWVVQGIDVGGKLSIDSEKNRFNIIPKGTEKVPLQLELQRFVQHGHVIEVRGKTEASARVMVNGQEVPIVNSDGSFQYLTPPLPTGETVITVTAQNAKGGVNTKQETVYIQ
jgi:hypothetical protein